MERVRSGGRGFVKLDVLHRENLLEVLEDFGVAGLSEAETDDLNRAWHRLDPWPDVLPGMARLRAKFPLAALSNGNVALIVNMARRAGIRWDAILGAEVARAYKPMAQAYLSAAEMLGLAPADVALVAAHNDDLKAAPPPACARSSSPAARRWRTKARRRTSNPGRAPTWRRRISKTWPTGWAVPEGPFCNRPPAHFPFPSSPRARSPRHGLSKAPPFPVIPTERSEWRNLDSVPPTRTPRPAPGFLRSAPAGHPWAGAPVGMTGGGIEAPCDAADPLICGGGCGQTGAR